MHYLTDTLAFIDTFGVNESIIMNRLDIPTMFKIREWERYKFMIDYEHRQVCVSYNVISSFWNRNGKEHIFLVLTQIDRMISHIVVA